MERRCPGNYAPIFALFEFKLLLVSVGDFSTYGHFCAIYSDAIFSVHAVQKFLKQHSRSEQLSSSDKILLLQLVSKEKSELELESKFKQHKAKLVEEINVPALLPYLQKHQVISREESERLNSTSLSERTAELLHIVSSKGPRALPKFFDCLSESPEHKELGSLFGPYQSKL